jgi:predicted RNase H-like nuclease (RuvC/YqgF family)
MVGLACIKFASLYISIFDQLIWILMATFKIARYFILFLAFILTSSILQAQTPASSSGKTEEVILLNKKLGYYQNRSKYLVRYSRRLKRKINSLTSLNKKLISRVDSLTEDHNRLTLKLKETIANNEASIQAYEKRANDLSNELTAMRDTIGALKIVKNDFELIKSYLLTLDPSPRDYERPLNTISQIIFDSFSRISSPYKVTSRPGQQIIVTEIYKDDEKGFLKRRRVIEAEYVLVLTPNPVNTSRTLLKLRTSMYTRQADELRPITDEEMKAKIEKRLLAYLDGVVYDPTNVRLQ